jgi:hypothetical protein
VRRAAITGGLACAALSASCLLFDSFDRFDPDAPDLLAGDANVLPGDATGPFTITVDVPAILDASKPGTVTVHIQRSTPEALHVALSLPQGTVVTPAAEVDVDATTKDVSFGVDAALGPRGPVTGTVRVSTRTNDVAQTATVSYRVTGPGDLDPTFGDAGIVTIPLPALQATLRAIATDGDALVLGGMHWPQSGDQIWTLAHSSATGLDGAFADAGVLADPQGTNGSEAHASIVTPSAIWASGAVQQFGGGDSFDVVVRRYSRAGALLGSTAVGRGWGPPPSALLAGADAGGGAWTTYWDSVANEMLVAELDATGTVVVAPVHNAMANVDFGLPWWGTDDAPGALRVVGSRLVQAIPRRKPFGGNAAPALVGAYLTTGPRAGQLDGTYGSSGLAEETGVAAGDVHGALGFAARSDGSIVVVGGRSSGSIPFSSDDDRMLVLAFSQAGIHDTTFRDDLAACQGTLFDGVEDPSGRIVLVGNYGSAASSTTPHRIAVVRLTPGGGVDRSFGSAGAGGAGCSTEPGVPRSGFAGFASADARRIALDGSGRILVAGRATRTRPDGTTEPVWFVARFRP